MMLLDGFFSFLALLSALMAVIISKFSRKTTKYYPHGLYFLEPLYAFFKAVLMLVLMVYALITSSKIAFDYFIHGNGQVMETAPLPYKRTNSTSTMLLAESKTNLIDGLQSAGIGVAILVLWLIPLDSALGFLHYTGDFFITLILVVTALKEPIELLFESFRELTGGICRNSDMLQKICNATGLQEKQFKVYKIGMRIKVCIPISDIHEADAEKKERMLSSLQQIYENATIEYVI